MADEIEVGVVLRGATPKGAEQIRKVLSLHHNTTFGDQRDEDMCDYLVVAGHNVGRSGRCTRRGLAAWAQQVLENSNEVP